MSGIIDKLKALVEPAPDAGEAPVTWPDKDKDPKYWVDDSVAYYTMPPEAATEWAPTDDKQIPGYRGVEDHGVPFNSATQYIIPLPQDVADANEAAEAKAAAERAVTVAQETIVQPIPVDIVSMPEPIGRQNRFSTTKYTVTANAEPVMIAPQSHIREKLMLSVLNADVVYIASNRQNASFSGYPLTAGKGDIELITTEAVYAWAPADATVYLLETHSVEVDERVK